MNIKDCRRGCRIIVLILSLAIVILLFKGAPTITMPLLLIAGILFATGEILLRERSKKTKG